MHISTYVVISAAAYLLGSIPFGYILVRLFTGSDVRGVGSGNIGATNVARTGRKGLAVATLALDALKGALAVYGAVAYAWWWSLVHTSQGAKVAHASFTMWVKLSDQHTVENIFQVGALAALCAVVGHMFPVWLGFKGGKGVATGLGVFVAIAPRAVLIALVVFVAVAAITRYVSLGSIAAAAVFPFIYWFTATRGFTPLTFGITCIIALLIVFKHRENIGRLMSGTESKFGSKKVQEK